MSVSRSVIADTRLLRVGITPECLQSGVLRSKFGPGRSFLLLWLLWSGTGVTNHEGVKKFLLEDTIFIHKYDIVKVVSDTQVSKDCLKNQEKK